MCYPCHGGGLRVTLAPYPPSLIGLGPQGSKEGPEIVVSGGKPEVNETGREGGVSCHH